MYDDFFHKQKEDQARENISNLLARQRQEDIRKRVSKLIE